MECTSQETCGITLRAENPVYSTVYANGVSVQQTHFAYQNIQLAYAGDTSTRWTQDTQTLVIQTAELGSGNDIAFGARATFTITDVRSQSSVGPASTVTVTTYALSSSLVEGTNANVIDGPTNLATDPISPGSLILDRNGNDVLQGSFLLDTKHPGVQSTATVSFTGEGIYVSAAMPFQSVELSVGSVGSVNCKCVILDLTAICCAHPFRSGWSHSGRRQD
jgi:hypothetical protein